jgi:membrane fusion protein, multidrug efflux system
VESARAGIAAARNSNSKPPRRKLQEAEANNVKAQNDLVRYKQLVDKQEISQQQYDQAVANAKASAAAVEGRRRHGRRRSAQVTEAQGKLVQAEANWRYAQTAPRQMQVIVLAERLRAGRSAAEESRPRSGSN